MDAESLRAESIDALGTTAEPGVRDAFMGALAQVSVGACVVTLFLSLDQSHVPAGASMTPTANIGVSIRSTESSIFACRGRR